MRPRVTDRDDTGPRRDLVGYGRRPPKVVWPADAKAVVSLCINYEEGSEYSIPAGDAANEGLAEINYAMPPGYRDLTAESVYEYGSRAGIWRLLRILDDFELKCTFFAAAVALERNPEVAAALVEAGHEPCSHGWRWEEVFRLSREQEREHIQWAVESITETCGERPVGWYCRYGPSVHTRQLLVEEGGFLYDSDGYNDDLPYFAEVGATKHLVVPYGNVYNDARYVLAQGYSSPSDFFDYCRRAVDELRREGHGGYPKMMSIGLHARWAGQAGRASALREFLDHLRELDDVLVTRRIDIARWWLDHHDEFVR